MHYCRQTKGLPPHKCLTADDLRLNNRNILKTNRIQTENKAFKETPISESDLFSPSQEYSKGTTEASLNSLSPDLIHPYTHTGCRSQVSSAGGSQACSAIFHSLICWSQDLRLYFLNLLGVLG